MTLIVVSEEVRVLTAGAARVVELGLVPGVRHPAVETIRGEPFYLHLDAVGRAFERILPVRCLRQHHAVVHDANLRIVETQQVVIAAVIHRSGHAQGGADPLLDAGFDGRRSLRTQGVALEHEQRLIDGRRLVLHAGAEPQAGPGRISNSDSSHGDALVLPVRSQRSTRRPGVIPNRAVGVHRYCAQPAADQVCSSACRSVASMVRVKRRLMRVASSELRLRAEFHKVSGRRIPFRSASPGKIEVAAFVAIAAVGHFIAPIRLQRVELLRHGKAWRRRESPLQIANHDPVVAFDQLVRLRSVILFLQGRAAGDDRRPQRLARGEIDGGLALAVEVPNVAPVAVSIWRSSQSR